MMKPMLGSTLQLSMPACVHEGDWASARPMSVVIKASAAKAEPCLNIRDTSSWCCSRYAAPGNSNANRCGTVSAVQVSLKNVDVEREFVAFELRRLQHHHNITNGTALLVEGRYGCVRRIFRKIVTPRPPILNDVACEVM